MTSSIIYFSLKFMISAQSENSRNKLYTMQTNNLFKVKCLRDSKTRQELMRKVNLRYTWLKVAVNLKQAIQVNDLC